MTTINIVTSDRKPHTFSYDIIVEILGFTFRVHYAIDRRDPCITVSIYEGTDIPNTNAVLIVAFESKDHIQQVKSVSSYEDYVSLSNELFFITVDKERYDTLMALVSMDQLMDFVEQTLPEDYWPELAKAKGDDISPDAVAEELKKHQKN